MYDAYSYQQPVQQDAYAYQDPYAGYQQQGRQPDPYAVSYEQQPDPYGGYQQPQQGTQDQQAALDETSFFDTSMINLDQLRQYEQGR